MTTPTISALDLDREIRLGAPITIVDIRTPDSFEEWHLDPGDARLLNLPSDAIARDPAAAANHLGNGRVRVMCTRGQSARQTTDALRAAGVDALLIDGGMIAWSHILTPARVPAATGATIIQFRREARGCLSYLVASDGDALVIDPGPDIGEYLNQAQEVGARITFVLDTHIHADHLSGAGQLVARTGATRLLSHGAAARGARFAGCRDVRDGDIIDLGAVDVRIVELPGHTTDNVGVLIDGAALAAGDSVFADSVARPDLEAGDDGAAGAARTLFHTIHERILSLPPETILLPCHYEGGRRGGPIAPTLGAVRDAVSLLSADEADFVTGALANMPPRPTNYEQIIAVNRDGLTGAAVVDLEVGANNCATSGG